MSKIGLVIIIGLLLQAETSFAQNYFVFIGTENHQPFYVRVDSEFHSSSPEGHLILSQLKDSTYTIAVGFPGRSLPEQHYAFNIRGKDQAFELRPQDPNGLRLYDLQNNEWLSPQGGSVAGDPLSAGSKKDDAFSRMMAGVVHDTAVLYNTYAMERALSDSPAVAIIPPAGASTTTPGQTASATPTTVAQSPVTQTPGPRSMAVTQSPVTQPVTTTSSPVTKPTAIAQSPVSQATTTVQSAPTDTAAAITAISSPPASTVLPDSAASKTTDSLGHAIAADTAMSRPAGAIVHQPAPRFNDSGSAAPLYRPTHKDSTAATDPIPSTVGASLYRKAPGVTKLSERRTPKNVRLVYADHSDGKGTDTIVVIIPVDTPAVAKTTGRQTHAADSSRTPPARAHGPNADSPTVGSATAMRPTVPPATPAEASQTHPADSNNKPAKAIAYVNSDCHDFATDFDVDKLRVRMLQSGKDDDRITVARKMFRSKCFYTPQIRTLSEVFTTDAAKFRFFEAAWPFAADEHFHELSDLLTDPVYNSKFKTMTHHP